MRDMKFDGDRLEEIVDIMLETVCTRGKTIFIVEDDYPAELVKAKFVKLDSEHIRFVLDCMRKNTTKIRNIKQYIQALLVNALSTIDNYLTSHVAHDMASGALALKGLQRPLFIQTGQKPVTTRCFYYGTENDGALVFDERTDRYDIRFVLASGGIASTCSSAASGSHPV